MVVAIVALVVAASGTAFAAGKIGGDKLIKKRSLSGNRLRNHTITGNQVNLKKLGKVPSAANADHANSATNASALGGQAPSSFLTASSRIGTNGIVKAPGTSGGNTVPLFTVGPFTVTMTCTKTGSGTSAVFNGSSSEANSVINGSLVATAGTPQNLGEDITATTAFNENDNVNIDFEAPSGAQAIFLAAVGVNSLGTDCWANFVGIR